MSACTSCGRFAFSEPTVCHWCRERQPQAAAPARHQEPVDPFAAEKRRREKLRRQRLRREQELVTPEQEALI